ncbi:transposase InsO family protein [Streptomyces sp. TE33382]
MRVNGLEGRHLRRRKRTTVPDRLAPPAPDLVQRDFTAARMDEKWCGDITYVQVGGAWLYLARVIDIYSRRVLGYSMASHMRAELVVDAMKTAVTTRGGNVSGVIFHADRVRSTRARRDWRSSSGSPTTTPADATAPSTTSHQPNSNSNNREHVHSHSQHEPPCPHSGGHLNHDASFDRNAVDPIVRQFQNTA